MSQTSTVTPTLNSMYCGAFLNGNMVATTNAIICGEKVEEEMLETIFTCFFFSEQTAPSPSPWTSSPMVCRTRVLESQTPSYRMVTSCNIYIFAYTLVLHHHTGFFLTKKMRKIYINTKSFFPGLCLEYTQVPC